MKIHTQGILVSHPMNRKFMPADYPFAQVDAKTDFSTTQVSS